MMKIKCYILSVIAGVFLFYSPANIATDAVVNGAASCETTIMYTLGLLALLGLGYSLGVEAEYARARRNRK